MEISTHTLTWSVTWSRISTFRRIPNFNSHAHVERDASIAVGLYTFIISTHTLTWSVTSTAVPFAVCLSYFNSHAHVERDTVPLLITAMPLHFNSHAHVERDMDIKKIINNFVDFNSHAHVERDGVNELAKRLTDRISTHTLTWSVTLFVKFSRRFVDISTHTLTWSVTCCTGTLRNSACRFQLTRSRGA